VPPDETKSGPNVTLRGYVARSDSSPRRRRINITSAHTLQQAGNFGDFVGDQRRQVLCLPGRGYRIVVSYTQWKQISKLCLRNAGCCSPAGCHGIIINRPKEFRGQMCADLLSNPFSSSFYYSGEKKLQFRKPVIRAWQSKGINQSFKLNRVWWGLQQYIQGPNTGTNRRLTC